MSTPEDGDEIASLLLGRLGSKFSEDLNSDLTISDAVSPLIEVSVGINVYRLSVWASVIDRFVGCCCVTSDGDEFQLSDQVHFLLDLCSLNRSCRSVIYCLEEYPIEY